MKNKLDIVIDVFYFILWTYYRYAGLWYTTMCGLLRYQRN